MFPEGVTAKNGFNSLKLKTVKAMVLKKVFWFLIVVGLCVCVCVCLHEHVRGCECLYVHSEARGRCRCPTLSHFALLGESLSLSLEPG